MKKYVRLYAIISLTIITGLLLLAFMHITAPRQDIDYVAVNEIVKQAALEWRTPEQLNRMEFVYRFTIIDNDGAVRYSTGEGLPDNIPAAVKLGYVPIDITIGTVLAGKALIETSPRVAALEAQSGLLRIVALTFILLIVLDFSFLLTLHNTLIEPFAKLQSFAHKIAAGVLDEPLPMDKRNIFGLFTQSFDIMRASLLEARKNQARAEREKKELIAALNHDVKTPVTSIRLISELLQAGTTDPATIEKLRTIDAKAGQIDRLMNDMLQSALDELGELKISVTDEESGVLKALFEDADYYSRVRIGAIPDCIIDLDRVRMEQVIGNIISNSYKYADTRIDVEGSINGDFLLVDVNDYGKGVAPEEPELLTAKFYRGENAKTSSKEGEGMGLYIAKLLMDKMGGGLEAFNRDDGFTIRLWLRLSQ